MSHAKKVCGYTRDCITRCCEHKGGKITYKGCYWVYEDEYKSELFSWNNYLNQISFYQKNQTKKSKKCQKIYQYDLQRNLVKIWDPFKEIEECGYTRNQVNTICNHRRDKKTHKGYIWAYEGYDFSDGYFDSLDSNYNLATEKRKKPILAYNHLTKETIYYSSATEAGKQLCIGSSAICHAIKFKVVCAEYFWCYDNSCWFNEYKEEYFIEKYNDYLKHKKKKVAQCDSNGCIIHIFDSLTEAANSVQSSVGNISRAISTNGLCKNFYWEKV